MESEKNTNNYYVVFRPFPKIDYKYGHNIREEEKTTKDNVSTDEVIGKTITNEHRDNPGKDPPLVIGKIFKDFMSTDGGRKAVAKIDTSTTYGKLAAEEYERGITRFVSPEYKLICYGTPYEMTGSKREYVNFAMTENPSFPGEGGPEIFAGWYENDLNINLDNDKQLDELTQESVRNLKASMAAQPPAQQTPVAQQPPVQAPAPPQTVPNAIQPPPIQAPQATPQTQAQQPPSPQDILKIAEEIAKNPSALDKLNPEEIKATLLNLSSNVKPQQPSEVIPTPQQLLGEAAQRQQQQQKQQSEIERAASELFKNKASALQSAFKDLNNMVTLSTGKNSIDPVKGEEVIRSWIEPMIQNPLQAGAANALNAAELFNGLMVHAAGVRFETANQTNRDQLKDIQVEQTANNIKRYLSQSQVGPMPKQQSAQPTPYDRPPINQNTDEWNTKMKEMVMKKLGTTSYQDPNVKTEYNPQFVSGTPQQYQQQSYPQSGYPQQGGYPQQQQYGYAGRQYQ